MNIVIDNREPQLYDNLVSLIGENTVSSSYITLEIRPLLLGDITLEIKDTNKVLVLFERKSLRDLLASITDGRYAEQSHRLIHTSNMHTHNIVYIIEGMYSQLRTESEKKRCLSAMTSLSYYKGFSVIRTCSIFETAEWIYSMATKIQKEHSKGGTPAFSSSHTAKHSGRGAEGVQGNSREQSSSEFLENTVNISETVVQINNTPKPYCEVVQKVKKENITPENIGEIILCTIPGISSTSAIEIMKHYSSFSHFMEEIKSNPEKLEEIYLSTNGKKRKLGKNIIENIIRFLVFK